MRITSFSELYPGTKNFVFIGEAGGGKSEIAITAATELAARGEKDVHFFDLDMTKPLFRSRDLAEELADKGIIVHFEEQFMDAPTVTGGVMRLLGNPDCHVVMDVGGDCIGARSIGGYAPFLNRPDCAVFYVINPYRPWSMDIEHIDMVLGQTLGVSHVELERLHLLGNPNLGCGTAPEDITRGAAELVRMVGPYKPVDFFTVTEEMLPALREELPGAVIPIRLNLTYEWNAEPL